MIKLVPPSILAAGPTLSRPRLSTSSLRLEDKDAIAAVTGHGDETGT